MPDPQLSLLVLRATDVERTQAFYEALGLTFHAEQHGSGPVHVSADGGGFVLEIYPAATGGAVERGSVGDVRLGFRVDAVSEVVTRLTAAGGDVVAPVDGDHGSSWVAIDPDGRKVELTT